MKERDVNDFNITFEGDINSIDVNLLTTTLLNFNTLIQEINKEGKTGKNVSLQIQTFQPGSYDIFCSLVGDSGVVNSLFSMLNKENLLFASSIIATLADILSIKEFLGGNKPESIVNKNDDSIIITNKDGQVKVTNKKAGDIIFNNPTINITINKTFSTLEGVDQIEGLSIKDNKGNNKFNITRDQFERLYSPNEVLEENPDFSKTITKSNVSLSVFKIVFERKYKWEFYYDGIKITATIEDLSFYEKLLNRKIQFMNGDIMVVDLEIGQVYNPIANIFENKKYVVKQIHEIRHQPNQTSFDFEDTI
jgi:hypothetical protein